jgi:HNH endonuclease
MGNTELRPIPKEYAPRNCASKYFVDANGSVYRKLKSRPRTPKAVTRLATVLINSEWHWRLKPFADHKGYLRIALGTGKYKRTVSVHRLVLAAYKPCLNWQNLHVNHIDRNTSNPRLENLEWCTHRENQDHKALTVRLASIEQDVDKYFEYFDTLPVHTYTALPVGMPPKYNIDKINTLLLDGIAVSEICQQTGASDSTVHDRRRKLGIEMPPSLNAQSQQFITEYVELHKELPPTKCLMDVFGYKRPAASKSRTNWVKTNENWQSATTIETHVCDSVNGVE